MSVLLSRAFFVKKRRYYPSVLQAIAVEYDVAVL